MSCLKFAVTLSALNLTKIIGLLVCGEENNTILPMLSPFFRWAAKSEA